MFSNSSVDPRKPPNNIHSTFGGDCDLRNCFVRKIFTLCGSKPPDEPLKLRRNLDRGSSFIKPTLTLTLNVYQIHPMTSRQDRNNRCRGVPLFLLTLTLTPKEKQISNVLFLFFNFFSVSFSFSLILSIVIYNMT